MDMFTGIIEEIGRIKTLMRRNRLARMEIEAEKVLADLKIGDSISVDGVCLTVVKIYRKRFLVEMMEETLRKTTFSNKKMGEKVNLERALRVGDRLGGHFITGHINTRGRILKKIPQGKSEKIEILLEEKLTDLTPKGSIAIDGISLTIGEIRGNRISIYLIPHTLTNTTLGRKKIGEKVNIESPAVFWGNFSQREEK
jgi:riboflavin synthase